MAAALAFTPASGAITAAKTAVRVDVTGADTNRTDHTEYRQYIRCELSGTDSMYSVRFAPSSAGLFTWDDVIFPHAGSWTVTLRDDDDDSEVATATVVVA